MFKGNLEYFILRIYIGVMKEVRCELFLKSNVGKIEYIKNNRLGKDRGEEEEQKFFKRYILLILGYNIFYVF